MAQGIFLSFWPFKRVKRLGRIGMILARKWKRMNQMSTPPFWGVFREVFRLRFVIPALGVTWKWALLSEPFHPLKAKNFKNMPRATFLTGKLQTTYSAKHSLRFFYFCAFWNTLKSKGLLWSYIIIASGIGDDLPILGALVTLFGGNCLLSFLTGGEWCADNAEMMHWPSSKV